MLTILLALLIGVDPGGTRADYERASSMPGEVRSLVLNERVEPIWATESAFFRLRTSSETWRFVRFAFADGARADAFDHDLAASTLGERLGRRVDPDRLPLTLVGDGGEVYASVEGAGLMTIDDGALVPVEGANVEDPRALEPVFERRSR
ncbi:MAG: hypothetical protein KDA28_11250, partial [Phycisphaerales bacterium]|nr:hypothetical protein [Phycisphaerales bacterium]